MKTVYKPFSCSLRLKSCETVPTVAAVHDICRFLWVSKVQPPEDTQIMTYAKSTISLVVRVISKVQPAEDTQIMTYAKSMISLVVRVISQSKYNFYDVIRLKIIESRYFPKETVKVGLEKSKQNAGQLKAMKCR